LLSQTTILPAFIFVFAQSSVASRGGVSIVGFHNEFCPFYRTTG